MNGALEEERVLVEKSSTPGGNVERMLRGEHQTTRKVDGNGELKYDELGFYRGSSPGRYARPDRLEERQLGVNRKYESCDRELRSDFRISYFDKIVDYELWKRGWDEFMRAKLIKQEPVTLNRELKMRVRSGIPHDYRCKVWTALIRMRTKSIRAQAGDDIYQIILRDYVSKVPIPDYGDSNNNLNSVRSWAHLSPISLEKKENRQQREGRSSKLLIGGKIQVDELLLDKCFRQIELDLLRTLPNNRHFEEPNSRGIQRVRRVLRAYACFNQTVGYCQGMNRLAAIALLVLPEEEAFWCLVAIIQCIMPKDYYLKPWLAQVDCCVLNELLERRLPKLHKHLTHNDIQLTLFSWFFTVYVDGFMPELMLRIWDCFLLEGDKVLFRIALSILYISQHELLKMDDFSAMSSHLSKWVSTRGLDMEQLFETFNSMNPLSTGTIQSRRSFHRNRLRILLEEQ